MIIFPICTVIFKVYSHILNFQWSYSLRCEQKRLQKKAKILFIFMELWATKHQIDNFMDFSDWGE